MKILLRIKTIFFTQKKIPLEILNLDVTNLNKMCYKIKGDCLLGFASMEEEENNVDGK